LRGQVSETQRVFGASKGWNPCKHIVKVTNASEFDPEVLSALSWIARVGPSWLDFELASSNMSAESDSSHPSELGISHIHDQMSIILADVLGLAAFVCLWLFGR
jgi:hypothetical protein